MINKSYREIAIANSTKQPQMVDQVLEQAPILAQIPMQEASHGLWNQYESQATVQGAGLVKFDGELAEVYSDTDLQQIDLSILGGIIKCGEDKAKKMGGFASYIKDQLPAILQKTGMDTEASILYNNFLAYALASSKAVSATGSANTNYSMVCVNWQPGQMTGLYDPNGFGKGAMLDIQPLANGGLYSETINSKNILIYGARLKSYIGIQLANPRYISSIVNIDKVNDKLPTEAQLDDMVSNARGAGDNTKIYCHRDVLTAIQKYKGTALRTVNESNEINRTFEAWNGIEIVPSYNFLKGTEANVTV